jgi:hypothetical protein
MSSLVGGWGRFLKCRRYLVAAILHDAKEEEGAGGEDHAVGMGIGRRCQHFPTILAKKTKVLKLVD